MKIFGYGSLLCEDSFKSTVKEFAAIGRAKLNGYKRTFNLKSIGRINPETGIHSCVLNIVRDDNFNIYGKVYEIPESEEESLHIREAGYDLKKIKLSDGTSAFTYISDGGSKYKYVENDPTQREYLDICLEASKKCGEEFFNNFIDTTFIGNKSLRELNMY